MGRKWKIILKGYRSWYGKYNLTQQAVFIDKENINSLVAETGFSNIGLLHMDLDGNDYLILEQWIFLL